MKQLISVSALLLIIGCGSGDTDSEQTRIADSISRIDDSISNSVVYKPDTTRVADSIAQAKAASDSTVNSEPTCRAVFRVLYTSNSCGGARPTQEIVEQYGTPALLTSSTLKFKNHHSGKEYFLKTSPDGEAAADMEEGKYDVFFTKDINAKLPHTGFDPKCSLWTNQLLLTVKVTANGKMQDVNVHFVCNPCDENSKMRQ